MVRIPEGSFLMGSEVGQDNERPVHRVWVDAFELAACQVTNAEYAQFLRATGHRAPLHWGDANFSHPEQPVVAPSWFDAVAYCEWLSRMTQRRYRLPTEAEWERAARGGAEQKLFPWGDAPPESLANYATRWRTAPDRWATPNEIPTASWTLARTCTNGAPIGMTRIIIASRRSATPRERPKAHGEFPEADRGGTKRKSRAAPRARAFLPNSNTRITVFASLATFPAERTPFSIRQQCRPKCAATIHSSCYSSNP